MCAASLPRLSRCSGALIGHTSEGRAALAVQVILFHVNIALAKALGRPQLLQHRCSGRSSSHASAHAISGIRRVIRVERVPDGACSVDARLVI